MIKKAWLTESGKGSGLYTLSMREFHNASGFSLHMYSYDFPPSEEVGGKKLNIDQAKQMGLAEPHHQLGLLTEDDLIKLREAINKVLGYE